MVHISRSNEVIIFFFNIDFGLLITDHFNILVLFKRKKKHIVDLTLRAVLQYNMRRKCKLFQFPTLFWNCIQIHNICCFFFNLFYDTRSYSGLDSLFENWDCCSTNICNA